MQEHYDVTYQTFKTNSIHFYNSIINNSKLISILNDANNQDLSIRNKARTKLAKIFKSKYQLVDNLGIDLIHFHLKNNESFFRRENPEKYGDDLTSVRYSVAQVNKTKKPIEGLEIGKHSHAFRFVYPLFDENKQHIGSLEGSVTADSFIKFMEHALRIHTHFIINKNKLDLNNHKLLEKYTYANGFENYLRLKNTIKTTIKHSKEEKDQIKKKLKNIDTTVTKSFSITVDKNDKEEIIIFIPIQNIKKEKTIAYFIVFDENNDLELILNDYTQQKSIALFISLLVAFLIFRLLASKQNLEIRVNKKTKELKDLNENLLTTVESKTKELQDSLNIISKYVIYSKTDLNGIITEVSDAFCEVTKYSKDELIGKTHSMLKHPDIPSKIYKELWSTIVSGKIWTGDILNKNKDGENYWISTAISKKYDNKGVAQGYIAIRHNITSKKQFEEQHESLMRAEKLASMGEMIGNIAHQWRQPLSVISTASTGIKMQKTFGTLSDNQLLKDCDLINTNAQYLSATIDDFRNFIKGDRTKKVFNLKDSIHSLIHIIDSTIKNNHINLILDLKEDITIDGYSNELTQCLINIFNNAKDILKEKNIDNRLVFISTSIENNKAIIKIKDNAGGIPNKIINHIFEPYFTTKHKAQGTGLGLHMTYNLIVDGMKGTIEATNKTYTYKSEEYMGAEFIITLNK